jgi:outer membrane receptor for ferrienterochelin and colicin
MRFNPKRLPITSKALFTIVGGAVLINPAFAQDQQSEEVETVVVTGIKSSMKASMDVKRDAQGVVDAITAEDIGKFPDTNLAESLQRITGVSIDRVAGEGSRITARGFGPGFNMVTVNGRVMPAFPLTVRSTCRTWPRKASRASRCTRPVAPRFHRVASVPPSI